MVVVVVATCVKKDKTLVLFRKWKKKELHARGSSWQPRWQAGWQRQDGLEIPHNLHTHIWVGKKKRKKWWWLFFARVQKWRESQELGV